MEGLDYPEAVLLLSDITLQFYPTVHWAAMEVFYVTSVSRPKSWPGSGRGAVALEMGFGGVTEGKNTDGSPHQEAKILQCHFTHVNKFLFDCLTTFNTM